MKYRRTSVSFVFVLLILFGVASLSLTWCKKRPVEELSQKPAVEAPQKRMVWTISPDAISYRTTLAADAMARAERVQESTIIMPLDTKESEYADRIVEVLSAQKRTDGRRKVPFVISVASWANIEEEPTFTLHAVTQFIGQSSNELRIAGGAFMEPMIAWNGVRIEVDGDDLILVRERNDNIVVLYNTLDEPLQVQLPNQEGSVYIDGGDVSIRHLYPYPLFKNITVRTENQSLEDMRIQYSFEYPERGMEVTVPRAITYQIPLSREVSGIGWLDGGMYFLYELQWRLGAPEERRQRFFPPSHDIELLFSRFATTETTVTEGVLLHSNANENEKIMRIATLQQQYTISDEALTLMNLQGSVGVVSLPAISHEDEKLMLTTPSLEGEYVMYLKDAEGFEYIVPFEVRSDPWIQIGWFTEELRALVESRFPLEKEIVEQELTRVFGSGWRTATRYDYDRVVDITYHLIPQERLTDILTVTTIFGNTEQFEIDLYIESMPEQFKQRTINGSLINLLPRAGYRGERFEVTTENLPETYVYVAPCRLWTPSFDQEQGYILEKYMFDCDETAAQRVFLEKPVDFARRKDTHYTVDIPLELADVTYFKASFYENFEESTHFVQSNIGLYAKVSDEDTLHLRAVTLDKGDIVKRANVVIRDGYKQTDLGSASLTNGYAQIPLQKYASSEFIVVNVSTNDDEAFFTMMPNGDGWLSYVNEPEGIYKSLETAWVLSTNDLLQEPWGDRRWGDTSHTKIYGYTDRALYRAGDTISYAWFVRDVSKIGNEKGYVPEGTVHVSLTDVQGNQIGYETLLELDEYGGFSWSFETSKTVALGTRYITYSFNGDSWISYSHDLRVEEFQKPTFFVEWQIQKTEWTLEIGLHPQYYFGTEVALYDLSIDRTLESETTCRRCRRRNDEEYYFNHTFWQSFTTGWALSIQWQEWWSIAVPLFSENEMPYRGSPLTLKATLKVRDKASDEVQFETIYLDIQPEVEIGLSGQPSEWLYGSENKEYELRGTLKGGSAEKITYAWYYKSYDHAYQYGVDGNRYYVDGREFTPLSSGHLDGKSFTIPADVMTQPWEYFLRVYAEDKGGTIIGEVQKSISRYDRSRDDTYMGSLKNNYQLGVSIPKKTRSVGDALQVDIDPYVKWATVIITVEKGNMILDTYTETLNGEKIEIPVKANYYPNVTVTVMEMVGEDADISEKRPEPRFYAWAATADIDENIVTMNIEMETDKTRYEPGEEVTLKIRTTDADGKPIDARVSVSVVDQALADLYHIIKEPIPAFYVKMATSVPTFTTLKWLYQALKVFVADGSKWGGGGPGLARFGDIRKIFNDIAFRQAAVYTNNWNATVRFTVPDNLTTRMIDTIAITKTGRLGTATSQFTVTKPLLLEANLPLFLTVWDSLAVPVKVVASKEVLIPQEGIELAGTLTFEDGRSIKVWPQFVKNNEKSVITLSLPADYAMSDHVILELGAKAWSHTDAVMQEIPVRSEGFTAYEFRWARDAETGSVITLDGEALHAQREVSLSRFPVQAFVDAFKYLLHYPYGCTEQLLSSLYPILIAEQLTQEWFLGDEYIRGETVNLWGYNGRSPIKRVIAEGFDKIWRHQNADGGLGYRSEWGSEYALSAYAYSVMKIAQENGFTIHEDRLFRLEEYLNVSDAGSLRDRLYADRQRVRFDASSIDVPVIENDATMPDLILAFAIAVEKQDATYANRYFSALQTQTEALWAYERYSPFLTPVTLRAIYLHALVWFESLQNISTSVSVEQRINEQVERLLEQRDSEGKRWRSTQDNMQALLALARYLKTQASPKSPITCSVTINNATNDIVIEPTVYRYIFSGDAENISSFPVSRSCDEELLGDVQVTYMVKDITSLQDQRVNVGTLSLELPDESVKISDTVVLTWAFSVEEDAEQVAVEFFIPSTIKLLETIRSKNVSDEENDWYGYRNRDLPFHVAGGNRYCYPSHREVRFDRLFLYYEKLPAGISCELSFKWLKAYEGTAQVMPTRLREMYSTDVRGRTIIQ